MAELTPLCVDLDGTLIKQDLFRIALFKLIKHSFSLSGFFLAALLTKGRAGLKSEVAKRTTLNASDFTFHANLIHFLKSQRELGREIILVTGNDQALAKTMANLVGIFSEVLASNGTINLTGRTKARKLAARFGKNGFDYIGNHRCDIPVWKAAKQVYIVSDNQQLIAKLQKIKSITRVFGWKEHA